MTHSECYLSNIIPFKGCVSNAGCPHFRYEIPNKQSQLAPPLRFKMISHHFAFTSTKPNNIHPLSVIGWNTVYFDLELLVV